MSSAAGTARSSSTRFTSTGASTRAGSGLSAIAPGASAGTSDSSDVVSVTGCAAGMSRSCRSRRSAASRWVRAWSTSGRWLSRVTCARSRSNSAVVPTCRARRVCRSVRSVCTSDDSAIATRRSASSASKYASVTSSRACAVADETPTSAARRAASEARACAWMRPPVKTFWLNCSPSVTVFSLAKMREMPANGSAAVSGSVGSGSGAPPAALAIASNWLCSVRW